MKSENFPEIITLCRSTKREIAYALKNRKLVRYYSKEKN